MGSALSFKYLGVLVFIVAGRVLGILAWRIVKGRYRNTVAFWASVQNEKLCREGQSGVEWGTVLSGPATK